MTPMQEEHTSKPSDPIGNIVGGPPISVVEKLTLRSLAAVLAADEVGAVLVHSDGQTLGVVSERDLARAIGNDADVEAVWSADVMTEELLTVDRNATILSVVERMVAHNVRHMVVTDRDEVIGVVSSRDVFRALTVDALEAGTS